MLTIGGLLTVGLVAGDTMNVKQLELQKEGIELIGQLEDVARDIHFNAEQLRALNLHSHSSKWSRQHHLTQIRELVNDGLQPALVRLTEIQPELKDWHQDTIDKMLGSARALAADTNSAILSHNEMGHLPPVMNPEYKELIANLAGHAQTLVKTADAAGDYASAHEQAEEAGLTLPKQ